MFEVVNQEAERAEIFDALGHPTRIFILKLLSHEALSFADLKRKMNIDSSGHLQHHLTKLNGLIKTDEHGNYRLSDTGNDALFAMQTVENASDKRRRKGLPRIRTLLNALIVALAVSSIILALYLSSISFALGQYAVKTQDDAIQYVNDAMLYANQTRDDAIQFANQMQYVAGTTKNQFLVDVITGSINDNGHMTIGILYPIQIEPGQTFNYTVAVFLPSNPPPISWAARESASANIPPPESNDTYYRQGFINFEVTAFSELDDSMNRLHYFPILGPENWSGLVLASSFSDLPPYSTMHTRDVYTVNFSAGYPVYERFLIPIEVLGNYTFRIQNIEDYAVNITYTLETPVVTIETKPLKEYVYPTWYPNYAGERIARIRQQFTPTWPPLPSFSEPPQNIPDSSAAVQGTRIIASNLLVALVLNVAALAILTGFAICRKEL